MKKRDWSTEAQPTEGRVARVIDGEVAYWTKLTPKEPWRIAAMSFADGYDHHGETGWVNAQAILYVDGDIQDLFLFRFAAKGKMLGPKPPWHVSARVAESN